MCLTCQGIEVIAPDFAKIVDLRKSLNDDAVLFSPFAKGTWHYNTFAETGFFDKDLPLNQYPDALLEKLLYGHGEKVVVPHKDGTFKTDFEGIIYRFRRLYIDRRFLVNILRALKQKSLLTRRWINVKLAMANV